LTLQSRKLGGGKLFRQEPEGEVGGLGPESNRIMIYECKSRKGPYRMLNAHFLQYQQYIREKRRSARARDRQLTSFLLIAPSFAGELNKKLHALSENGVNASATVPESILHLYSRTEEWPLEHIRLIDPCKFLHTGLITKRDISTEIDRVLTEYGPPAL